jgi:hypothetical protein
MKPIVNLPAASTPERRQAQMLTRVTQTRAPLALSNHLQSCFADPRKAYGYAKIKTPASQNGPQALDVYF